MNLYYFFEINHEGLPTYGEEYFVMSDSLEAAKDAVVNCIEYKKRAYADITKMGYSIHGINEVVQTEIS